MNLENKTVLVTGASTGIGKAIAQKLLKVNCKLILLSRRVELINEYAGSPNNNLLVLKCDVSKREEVVSAYTSIKEKFGEVDVAILNSGIGRTESVRNYNSKDAEDIFGANVFGLIYWIEQLLPDFVSRRDGVIVGVSSLADNRGYSGSGFYCASKAAATTYLEGLRIELKPFNIKVITVRPGFVRTPMTDQNKFKMPMLMEPEKAAEIILSGIEKEKNIIQFPFAMYLLTRIVGAIPNKLYEWLAGNVRVK